VDCLRRLPRPRQVRLAALLRRQASLRQASLHQVNRHRVSHRQASYSFLHHLHRLRYVRLVGYS